MRYAAFMPIGLMHMVFVAYRFFSFKGRSLAETAALLTAINGVVRIVSGISPCEVGRVGPRILLGRNCTFWRLASALLHFVVRGFYGVLISCAFNARDYSGFTASPVVARV
jgi:hypothetical protein